VCRQCRFYDSTISDQCREDDAEPVTDKETANFCDYFSLGAGLFDAGRRDAADQAQSELDALFGNGEPSEPQDESLQAAEDLFRDG